jgi:hypothetical protein
MKTGMFVLFALLATCVTLPVKAQTATDLAALKGLAPAAALTKSAAGRAALAANYKVTGGIQTGTIQQPTLLPFPEQQQQALRDAFITVGNLAQLADGLGTTLGAAYVARAHYLDTRRFTSISSSVANLIAYMNGISAGDSNAAKYFFANATTNGKTPVSPAAAEILTQTGGETDVFGKSYGFPAGAPGADAYGDSRPFQTEPNVVSIVGPDYLNVLTDNAAYNRGPLMNLVDSPSFPSGHTTYGYTGALLLALLVPERYQEMVTRGAEYGNDRILLGSHYAMDVLAGRTLATYDVAHFLAGDRRYLGLTLSHAIAIKDPRAAVSAAREDLNVALKAACGNTVEQCAREDIGRFNNRSADEGFYSSTQTYDLPVVYPQYRNVNEDVGKVAPEAGYLLTVAFPSLTLEEADKILTETEGPGGGFLDNGSAFGIYSRLNLYAAAGKAAALAPNSPSAR